MKNRFIIFTSFLLLLSPLSGRAADSKNDCRATNYSELVRCAEMQSSDIKISEQQLKSAQNLKEVANQWINPELDADTVAKGSDRTETNVSVLFTLRLGGKKEALVTEAEGEIERATAHRDLGVHQSRLEIMLSFYRLAHLKTEIETEKESVETFSKIIKQYQNRAALSPEQDVSLSVFKMALADHQLRLTKLKSDEEKLFQTLRAVTGLSKDLISKNLPPVKKSWPAIDNAGVIDQAPQVRATKAELKLARGLKLKAEGDSWPDLKIGPTMKAIKENGESITFVGVGLSMPLPIFSQNGAGRSYSAQKLAQAEMSSEQAQRKAEALRAELIYRYNLTTQNLKESLSLRIVNEKHQQLERQFFKGLVPSSLVIEAHRQLFDLEERRNASELEALETLGQILILDNKFNEVIL